MKLNINTSVVKDKLSLKIQTLHIHMYFIGTQIVWKYALMVDIDNSVLYSYNQILKSSKIVFNRLALKEF